MTTDIRLIPYKRWLKGTILVAAGPLSKLKGLDWTRRSPGVQINNKQKPSYAWMKMSFSFEIWSTKTHQKEGPRI